MSPKNNYKFNGVEFDVPTGMYAKLFKGYDPALGRFAQIDPLADFIPGISSYHFGFNNPIGYTDPTGLLGFGKEERRRRRSQRRARKKARQERKNSKNGFKTDEFGGRMDPSAKVKIEQDDTYDHPNRSRQNSPLETETDSQHDEAVAETNPEVDDQFEDVIEDVIPDPAERKITFRGDEDFFYNHGDFYFENDKIINRPNKFKPGVVKNFLTPIAEDLIKYPILELTLVIKMPNISGRPEIDPNKDSDIKARARAIQRALIGLGVKKGQIGIWFGKWTKRYVNSPYDSQGNFQSGFGDGNNTVTFILRKRK